MLFLDQVIGFIMIPIQSQKNKDLSLGEFAYLLFATFAIIVPYSALMIALGLDELDHSIMELLDESPIFLVVVGVLIAPILEEPIFRLHLDLTKKSIYWSLGLSIFLISEFWYPLIFLWIYLIWLLIRISKNYPPKLKGVVYSSAIFFGLVHLGNFTSIDYSRQFYLIPILIAGQVFVGLILSFIRLNYGMKWAIIFHGVYNGILISAYILFYQF